VLKGAGGPGSIRFFIDDKQIDAVEVKEPNEADLHHFIVALKAELTATIQSRTWRRLVRS
jgi:hypothetical protein